MNTLERVIMKSTDHKRLFGWKSQLFVIVCFIFMIYQVIYDEKNEEPIEKSVETFEESSKTWITMSLCWSENAQVHGKWRFPYKKALPFSTALWLKFAPVKVIVQIVYSEYEISSELRDYKTKLEALGALVYLVKTGNEIDCVLKSQLVRLLAYELPYIKDNDIIVTADVDAFVMSKDLYKPLTLPNRQIWIFRYDNTLMTGSTFNMPFIGIRKETFKTLLNYNSDMDLPESGTLGQNLPEMVKHYIEKLDLSEASLWDLDQNIFTHEILSSGLCTLPAKHKLWSYLHVNENVTR